MKNRKLVIDSRSIVVFLGIIILSLTTIGITATPNKVFAEEKPNCSLDINALTDFPQYLASEEGLKTKYEICTTLTCIPTNQGTRCNSSERKNCFKELLDLERQKISIVRDFIAKTKKSSCMNDIKFNDILIKTEKDVSAREKIIDKYELMNNQ